ncbi:MAG TPA: hypothetical protein VJJ26_00900 [Candidatus Babeliales bacterium]|nr:hypothetical protein [Candidatus Babeliales bacterium]
MKRYALNVVILLAMHTAYAMDLAMVDKEKCRRLGRYFAMTEGNAGSIVRKERNTLFARDDCANNPKARQILACKGIATDAINFIGRIPDITLCNVRKEFDALEPEVAKEVEILSKHNVLVTFALHKDAFTYMCFYLPDSYEDHGGFFDTKFNEGVQEIKPALHFPNHFNFPQKKEQKVNKNVSRDKMIAVLISVPTVQALSVFRYVTQKGVEMSSRFDNLITDDSLKGSRTVHTKGMKYYFTHEDLKDMTEEQEELLRLIVEGSNNGKYSWQDGEYSDGIDNRFKIEDKHIQLLRQKKDFIVNNELFKNAQITTDITSPTKFEKMKDKLLLLISYLPVMIVPDLVHSQTSGLLQGTAGLIACSTGCTLFDQYHYPIFDSCHSDVGKLSKWFGPNNHAKVRMGLEFFWFSTFNYLCTAIVQKFFAWGTMPWKIIGGTVGGIRVLVSLYIMKFENDHTHRNPFKRSSKAGVPFTLEDLVKGPKFNMSQQIIE